MANAQVTRLLNRQRRKTRMPGLAARMAGVGLSYAFMADDEQNALRECFRETARPTQEHWLDFPTVVDAARWIEAEIATMPPLAVVIPAGDLDEEPALLADPSRLLALAIRDPTFLSDNGCLLLAVDGSAGLELFPNHTSDGDVVSVQSWSSLVGKQADG